jgi:hypothetical protein
MMSFIYLKYIDTHSLIDVELWMLDVESNSHIFMNQKYVLQHVYVGLQIGSFSQSSLC